MADDVALAEAAIEMATSLGADYVDVRLVHRREEGIEVRNGRLLGLRSDGDHGIGVRVLVDGAWGFAGNPDLTRARVEKTVRRALALAEACAHAPSVPVALAPEEVVIADYVTPHRLDPFRVPLETKIERLLRCDDLMRRERAIKVTYATMDFLREEKLFLSSEGSRISQTILHSGAGLEATASDHRGSQTRSFPSSFRGHHRASGWEFVEGLNLEEGAVKIADEAVRLLSAPLCPAERTTLILGESQLALQIHESCGHPSELDRIYGMEANYAGKSYLGVNDLEQLRIGSDKVNVTADATLIGGLGTFAYDDDGTPAQRVDLIREGVFSGVLSSRETAARMGQTSNGTARAQSWNHPPIVRMTNINLEPGDTSLQQLIDETERGLLLTDNRSWSIDDRRLNFQFGAEVGWLIERGKVTQMVRNPTYTGITPQFWQSCDAVSDGRHWQLWGTVNCGKGQPPQTMRVGHGCSYARFQDVQVGASGDL